jgi:hypothetical protein
LAIILAFGMTTHSAAQTGRTRIGIFFNRENAIEVGKSLGVHYQRYHMPINAPNSQAIAKIHAAEAAGFKIQVGFDNFVEGSGPTARSGAVIDDESFKTALAADLDTTKPILVSIQNEENNVKFYPGTPEEYLHELSDAVQVAHAKGYKITNGGLGWRSISLAYWHHLWLSGRHEAADRFAQVALSEPVLRASGVIDDIPDSRHPNRPVLNQHGPLRTMLDRVEPLIAGYKKTGIDYINFHWYGPDPAVMGDVVTWLEQETGLQAVSNEMGQYSMDSGQITGLLNESIALHLPYVFWFAHDGRHGPSRGLAELSGAIRPNGLVFKAFVAEHP